MNKVNIELDKVNMNKINNWKHKVHDHKVVLEKMF